MLRRRLHFPVKHYLEHILAGWSDACGRTKTLEGKDERKNECGRTGKNSNTEAGHRGDEVRHAAWSQTSGNQPRSRRRVRAFRRTYFWAAARACAKREDCRGM